MKKKLEEKMAAVVMIMALLLSSVGSMTALAGTEVTAPTGTLAVKMHSAVDSGTCGDNLTWELTSDGTLTISGTGEMSDYSSYSVSDNYAPWSEYREDIKCAVINEGVTTIGSAAFYACNSLTSVSIPNTVTEIGDDAFMLASITSLIIPDNVTTIGSYAFYYSDLVSVTIPSGVEEYKYAFVYCPSLESVVLSYGITKIDSHAFSSCGSLTSVSIPTSVEEIGVGAFDSCEGLVSITIPSGVTLIDNVAFSECYSLESVSLPVSLTTIGNGAFYACYSLKNISLPDGLTKLDTRAFYLCSSLTSVMIPSSITTMGTRVFGYCDALSNVYITDGCTTLGENAFYECYSIQSVTLPGSLTDYEWAFENCSGLENVILSDGISFIDEGAFSGCASLTGISFPDSLTSIGDYAFLYSGLTQINVPPSVESIGGDAFGECENLKRVTLSEGLLIIGIGAFERCASLISINIPSSVTSIGAYAFQYDDALATVKIDAQQSALTVIEEETFSGCYALTEIDLPDRLESIENFAFDSTSIEEISVPESVSTLGAGVFYGCMNLTKIVFEGCAPEIGNNVFYEVTANVNCYEYLGWNEDNMLDYGGDLTWNVIPASFAEGYDFEEDSYSFVNYNCYYTQKKYFTTMYEEGTGSALYDLKKTGLSGGLCAGMSYTTAAIFNGYPGADSIISSGIMRDMTLSTKLTIGSNTIRIKDYIKYAAVYQWSSEYWEDDDATRDDDADAVLTLAKAMAEAGSMGIVLKLRQYTIDEEGNILDDSVWSHLVTVVGYSGNILLIDDSNYRDELQVLTVHSDGTWEYSGRDEISEENCVLSYHLDYWRPYQILSSGNGTTTDAADLDGDAEEETFITGTQRLDSDNLLLYLAGAGDAVISGETVHAADTSGTGSDAADEDSGDLYWALDTTEVSVSGLDADTNTIWAAGDNTVIKMETGAVDSVDVSIKEDAQTVEIASDKGETCTIEIDTVSDDGDTTVSAAVSGTANGVVSAENTDDGLSVSGFSEVTVTLAVNDEERTAETIADTDGNVKIGYDSTGDSSELTVESGDGIESGSNDGSTTEGSGITDDNSNTEGSGITDGSTIQSGSESDDGAVILKSQKIKIKNSALKRTIKYKKLKKKRIAFKLKATASGNGKIIYKKINGDKKIKVSKYGKVLVKKGLPKGTYKVTVKITAARTVKYKKAAKTVILKIKVK